MSQIKLSEFIDRDHPMKISNKNPNLPNQTSDSNIGVDGLPTILSNQNQFDPNYDSGPEERYTDDEDFDKTKSIQPSNQTKIVGRFGTIMNILNSMLGAGILSIPNSYANTGIITSTVLLLIIGVFSFISTTLLILMAHQTNSVGLGELTNKILGRVGTIVLTVLNLLFLLTALVAYLVLAGDMLISFFKFGNIDLKPLKWHAIMELVYGLCLPIALTIPKDISFLKYFSTATCICIIYFCISLLIKAGIYCQQNHQINSTAKLSIINLNLFSSLSIYGLSFSLPAVILPPIRLYKPSIKKRMIAAGIAVCIAFIFFIIPGICGYIIYGEDTDGNILNNFPTNDALIIICRAAFLIVVTCAYPMIAQSVQAMWSQLIFGNDQPASLPFWRRFGILVLTNVIPLIIAMLLPSAKPALSIGGALGGCLVDFTFPSVMYIVLHKPDNKPWYYWKTVLNGLLAAFGIVTAVIATYKAIEDAINAFS